MTTDNPLNSNNRYIQENRKAWEEKTTIHINSEMYNAQGFLNGKNTLHNTELKELGDVNDKKIIHLQCHFGLDTLSLARLGAIVTGVDFSSTAIEYARKLSEKTKINARFIESDIYDVSVNVNDKYDIVFTSYGAICWISDIRKWAEVVSSLLKPEGALVLVDFQPMFQYMDFHLSDTKRSYFNRQPITRKWEGTYTDYENNIVTIEHNWNHGIGEIFHALKDNNIYVENFEEYSYLPINWFPGLIEGNDGLFRTIDSEGMYPLLFSIKAVKK